MNLNSGDEYEPVQRDSLESSSLGTKINLDARSDVDLELPWKEFSARANGKRRMKILGRICSPAFHLMFTIFFITTSIILGVALREEHNRCFHPATANKGSSFIPADVGRPSVQFTAEHVENYPTFLDLETFHNITYLRGVIKKTGLHHKSTGVAVKGNYMTFLDKGGQQRTLHPKLTTSGAEAYIVAGLHQMHCWVELLQDYGYLVNGYQAQWGHEHAIHCFNLLHKAITCLSDATAEGLEFPEGSMPLSTIPRVAEHRNQPECRDFSALMRWAEDPQNALPFEYLSGHIETEPERLEINSGCQN